MKTITTTSITYVTVVVLGAVTTFLPLSGQQPAVPIAPNSPTGLNSGAVHSTPTGAYPGTGSSVTNAAPQTPQGVTPGAASTGTQRTPPSGVTPGTGTSPNP